MIRVQRLFFLFILTVFSYNSFAAAPEDAMGASNGPKGQNLSAILQAIPAQSLDESEKIGLIKLYEEEKLARDVYLEMHRLWALQIFSNISRSEQQHMNAVELLLKRYNLEYSSDEGKGRFSNSEMAGLYTELTKQGSKSAAEALLVGATIEDFDLKDLFELTELTNNEDVTFVCRNLAKGSRNHLRSFSAQLRKLGLHYTAQYLSAEQIDKIIATPHERGPM